MANLPYGFTYHVNEIVPDVLRVKVVVQIYDSYISGLSLGGISDMLHEKGIPTPSGKEWWATTVLFEILTNNRYLSLVGLDRYLMVQGELNKRSKYDMDTGKRKTERYHSKNVLSGLFVCSECSRSYRRVQRASGEIVWRCANRVEHGSRVCKSSPTITEGEAVRFVCGVLDIPEIDQRTVLSSLETIIVNQDGSMAADLFYTDPLLEMWQ